MAMGLNEMQPHGSLRLTLGKYTSEEDVDYVVESIKDVVGTLRGLFPL